MPWFENWQTMVVSRKKSRANRFGGERLVRGFDDECSLDFVELELEISKNVHAHCKIKIWADRWCYIAAWKDLKGTPRWQENIEGRAPGDVAIEVLYNCFLHYADSIGPTYSELDRRKAKQGLEKLLRRGPRAIP